MMYHYYQDLHNTLYNQDFRENELLDGSVQCVVTSPPYWGLRKYSGEQELIWGGEKDCEHEWGKRIFKQHSGRGDAQKSGKYSTQEPVPDMILSDHTCSLCGAWKGAYGLEPTPEMYIEHTIQILREIRRVLRKDGVVFWNIGDSYAGSGGANENKERGGVVKNPNRKPQSAITGMEPVTWEENGKPKKKGMTRIGAVKGLKPKDLCLIPFRVAIAAQEDGWWVRSVIIWSKPNPMPESVTDRPTNSHEYVLMLTKSARYYWDADAVRMSIAESTIGRGPVDFGGAKGREYQPTSDDPNYRGGSEQWGRTYKYNGGGRNIRSVWDFPTQPYPEAHFAVFPEKLPEICIKAATPEVGCCNKCGAPWERILDKKPSDFNIRVRDAKAGRVTPEEGYKATQEEIDNYPGNHPDPGYRQTIGWQPTCKCNNVSNCSPSLVLDPFAGAGTTLWVAKKLNRRAVGYEISEEYCQLAVDRCRQQVMI